MTKKKIPIKKRQWLSIHLSMVNVKFNFTHFRTKQGHLEGFGKGGGEGIKTGASRGFWKGGGPGIKTVLIFQKKGVQPYRGLKIAIKKKGIP